MGIAASHASRFLVACSVLFAGCQGGVGPLEDVPLGTDDGGVSDSDGGLMPTADGSLLDDAGPGDPDAGASPEPEPPPPPPPAPPPPDPDWSPADCPRVRVTTRGVPLNVRPTATTDRTAVGSLEPGTVVDVHGAVHGERIDGIDLWYEISSGPLRGFIYSGYAACTSDAATFGTLDGYFLPLTCGTRARISQGNNGTYSHRGSSAYAFDFSLGVGTRLRAMADGVVIGVYDATGPGDRCYNGGGSECGPYANRVVLRHADGTATQYGHLSVVRVSVGDTVRRGRVVGLSGSTGYSTGPHAHIQRQELCGRLSCQSLRLRFADVPGDGVPSTGDYVTSGNCP